MLSHCLSSGNMAMMEGMPALKEWQDMVSFPGMQRSESRFDKMSLKFAGMRFLPSSKRKTGEAGSNISAAFCRRMSHCRLAREQQPKCSIKKLMRRYSGVSPRGDLFHQLLAAILSRRRRKITKPPFHGCAPCQSSKQHGRAPCQSSKQHGCAPYQSSKQHGRALIRQ
jgi:hypothetical protein